MRLRLIAWAALAVAMIATPVAAQEVIAITGVTLIDGTGAPPRRDMTVQIEGGRIKTIGKAGTKPVEGAKIVDGRGRYLLPGFIDSNVHVTVYGNPARRDTSVRYADRGEELALEFAQRSLKSGVTTIRDSYGVLPPTLAIRDRIERGEAIGSRLKAAGNIVGWGGPFSLTFSLTKESDLSYFQEQWNDLLTQDAGEELLDMTPDELRAAIRRYLDKGVDFIKYGGTSHFLRPSLIGFSPRAQKVIVEEAHRRGKPVETHATSSEGLRLAVEAGIDLIQHPELMSRDLPDDLIRLIVDRGVLCGVRANYITGEVWQRHLRKKAEAQARIAQLPPATTSAERNRRSDELAENEDIQRRNAERLIKAGCRVTVATDNFFGDAPEFRRTPKGPEAEPGSGTILAIKGLVEPGKIADLVLLSADPLTDIANLDKVEMVIARGRIVDTSRLPEKPVFARDAVQTTGR